MEEMRRDAETVGNACECYVKTAEIKQGRLQEDPGECLRNCKAQFLRSVLNGWQENEGWVEGCGSLNRGVAVQEFWSLYWCDSTFCGVGIDQGGGLGQDPSVDLIINTCQNIGFYSILDPGPPPPNFTCRTEAETSRVCSASMMQVPQTTQGRQPGVASPISASTTPRIMTTTQAKSTPAVVASQPTSAPPATTESPAPPVASTTSGSNLTGQGKAAIALCSVLALILLVTFALVWLRRRKRRKASFHRALRSRRGLPHGGAPAGSPTPLISPASSAIGTRTILTPPLRLRERRFLPSILRPGSRSPSPPLTPLTPAYSPQPGGGGGGGAGVFPSSPISQRPHNRHTPHLHRLPPSPVAPFLLFPSRIWKRARLARINLFPARDNNHNNNHNMNRGSASASSCYTGGTSSTAHSSLRHEIPIGIPFFMGTAAAAGGMSGSGRGSGRDATPPPLFSSPPPAPPGSPPPPPSPWPCRPPRPHEGMLQIPDLVTPAAAAAASNTVGVGGSRAGSVATPTPPPPPPPPLSPPPTRALPKTPAGPATGSPPPLKGGSARGPPPPPRLLGMRSPVPVSGTVPGAGVAGGSLYHHDGLQSAGYPGGPEMKPQQEPDGRASWGSWSGTGTVVGGSSYHASSASNVNVLAGVVAEPGAAEGGSGGDRPEAVSPRTSQSSGLTATGDTMVSAVSRMSSMRDDTVDGRI
ncbi:hypothetical protein C8A01DRAFT_48956 [Parachaetomium inaequale]|uniref:Uncharacterized protein n=1 Tax=Parachaetomium inaequale TaxID=2588326 RepID=A0AAN6SP96_9PEZI|nr:hypothetical protein C8A01DRAFT_48956 [Parachaetomium inaequale]